MKPTAETELEALQRETFGYFLERAHVRQRTDEARRDNGKGVGNASKGLETSPCRLSY